MKTSSGQCCVPDSVRRASNRYVGISSILHVRKLKLRQNEITCSRWEIVGSIKSSWKDWVMGGPGCAGP